MINYSTFLKAMFVAFIALSITACGSDSKKDKTAPVITISGANPTSIIQDETYTDAGATAIDNEDGSVTVTKTGSVDTSTIGDYTITYTASDSAGNEATATRTVNVVEAGTQVISGLLIDPEIEGAVIKICKIANRTDCLVNKTVTNFAGGYSLSVPDNINKADYLVISSGGQDVVTNEDFTGTEFSIPLALYKANTPLVITPITKLISIEVTNGKTIAQAKTAVSQRLDLTEEQILLSPNNDFRVLKKSMLLAQLAKKGVNFSGTSGIGSLIENLNDEPLKERLTFLRELVDSGTNSDTVINHFIVARDIIKSDLIENVDLSDATTKANLKRLTGTIGSFLTVQEITRFNTVQVQRVLAKLKAGDDIDLASSDYEDPTIESGGVDYTKLTVNRLINHKLDTADAIANTSEAKRDYYFGSTASYLYKAEKMMADITDGNTLGEVFENLSESYIKIGQPDLAIKLADRKLFDSSAEAKIIAKAIAKQIDLNVTNDASEANLDKALTLMKTVITEKGAVNIKSKDSGILRNILTGYIGLNKNTKEDAFNDYLGEIEQEFGENYSPYASLGTGFYLYAKELAAQGKYDLARDSLISAETYASNMPANGEAKYPTKPSKWNYKARVFLYAVIAQTYYNDLGTATDKEKANELVYTAMAIRANDGITENGDAGGSKDTSCKTDLYAAKWMFPIKTESGISTDDAETFINTLCKGSYKAQAWRSAAIAQALSGDANAAIATINTHYTAADFKGKKLYRAKVDALTYNGKNRRGAYMALKLIQDDKMTDAKTVIDAAKTLLVAEIEDGGQETKDRDKARYYVERGYTKLGELYFLAGFTTEAAEMYAKAEAVLTGAGSVHDNAVITDEEKIAEQYIMLARSYAETKQLDKLDAIISTTITKSLTIADTGDKIDLLEDLIEEFSKPYLDGVTELKPSILTAADAIFDVATGADALDNDSNQEDLKAKNALLQELVASYQSIAENTKANLVITKWLENAELLASESDKTKAYQKIVEAYAQLGQVDQAFEFAKAKITTKQEFLESVEDIAKKINDFDAFVNCDVASVDNDQDGKPDFYNLGATEDQINACGLTLDDDSDNDSDMDGVDLTPFYDKAS